MDGIYLLVDGFAVLDDENALNASRSDSEIQRKHLVQLYKREGVEFLRRLRGSFAIALWNPEQKQLILGADPFGTRPLYFWCAKDKIVFAPRISWFAEIAEIPKTVDPNSVYFYINHSFIPAPFTIYKDIRRLEPGQYLVWANGQASIRQYWDMTYAEDGNLSEIAAASMVRSSVEESLRFFLQHESHKDGEVGAFLSGGTDSSTLLGLLTQIRAKPTKSFSVGFDEKGYNEIYYARVAGAHFNSLAHEYFVRPKEALEAIPVLAQAYDEPFGNSSAIPTYFCLKMARGAGVKVMFAGDGGDELFAGNERYLTEKVFSLYHQLPRWIRRCTDLSAAIVPAVYPLRKIKNYVRKANQPAAERFFSYQLYFQDHAEKFLTHEFRDSLDVEFPLQIPKRHYERMDDASPLNRLLYVDLKLAIADNDLFKVNRMAESQGIKVRYPYLDPHVGTASGKIPGGMKIKGWNKRYIFKKAFGNLLPAEILRKKKHGFGLPTGHWLKHDPGFRDLARSLLLDLRSVQRGYFKRSALEELLRLHDAESSSYYGAHIWNFMMLELWHRTHADKATNP